MLFGDNYSNVGSISVFLKVSLGATAWFWFDICLSHSVTFSSVSTTYAEDDPAQHRFPSYDKMDRLASSHTIGVLPPFLHPAHHSEMITLTFLLLFVSSASAWSIPASGCSISNVVLSLPPNQTQLIAPSTPPDFISIGVGVQNYTCGSAGTFA